MAGGVVRHGFEGDIRPAQQAGCHLGRDTFVTGQLLDDLHLVRLGDPGDDRRAPQEVRSDRGRELVLAGQLLHHTDLVLVPDLRDHLRPPQQAAGDTPRDLVVLGERVDRADLLLRGDGLGDLASDPPVGLVRRPTELVPQAD